MKLALHLNMEAIRAEEELAERGATAGPAELRRLVLAATGSEEEAAAAARTRTLAELRAGLTPAK